MGEVYRGIDTRLGRPVAIKILQQERALRDDARVRFDREAKAVSQLAHPNICTLHDVGEADVAGTRVHYLVMELLEGETLADRISRGAMPVDQVVQFAMQIAAALDAAHRRGIVHRDLKPANIMVTPSGVKLLDFGLAKSLQPASLDSAALTVGGVTGEDVIVGTLQYMPPEQLTGGAVDARSDIFAFGAVMFEMITGQRAFQGTTQASLIAAIIHDDPPRVSQRRPVLPRQLDRVIAMCLHKDPEERWQNARDVLLQLRSIGEEDVVARPPRRQAWAVAAIASGVAVLITAGIAMVLYSRTSAPQPARARYVSIDVAPSLPLQPNGFGAPFDIARDASKVVWVGVSGSTVPALFVRRFDSLDVRRLPGTELASAPFFSPDGESVGFFASGHLRVASLRGDATVRDLADTGPGAGGTWLEDQTIVFASLPGGGLTRVPISGGRVEEVTAIDRRAGEGGHSWPFAIPGTHVVLFTLERDAHPWEEAQIVAYDLETKQRKVVLDGGTRPRYAAGKLFFTRGTQLLSVPFDAKAIKVAGSPALVIDGVVAQPGTGGSFYAIAADATIAYLRGGPSFYTTRAMTRAPDGVISAIDLPVRTFANPRFSSDGTQLALQLVSANDDIWIYHRQRRTFTRMTAQAENLFPNWSPDDREFLVSTFLDGGIPVAVTIPVAGGQPRAVAPGLKAVQLGTSWSKSGRIALSVLGTSSFDIYVIDRMGAAPRVVAQSRFNEHYATLSPDGRYLAYVSDESGDSQIYVRGLGAAGEKLQISVSGGREPLWSRDGRVIYFRDTHGFLAVDVSASDAAVTAGAPRRVFDGDFVMGDEGLAYDVAPDGTFVLLQRNGTPDDGARLQIVFAH